MSLGTGSDLRSTLRKKHSTFNEHRFSYLFVLPVLVLIIAVLWLPFLAGAVMSLFDWPFGGIPTWVGLGNYIHILEWEVFYTSFWATVVFAMSTFIQLGLALVAALVVANISYFKNLINGIFLLPYTMPPIVTGTIWLFLLHPEQGPSFTYLERWGVLTDPIYWQSDGTLALLVITLVAGWTFWPFMFLILLASLESIPSEQYETARMYGANRIQTFLRVTLPQLKTAILIVVSLRFIWNLSKVSQPFQITQGGPGFDTSILPILLYRIAFERAEMGLANAVGIILLLLVVGFVFLFIREYRRESEKVKL